MLRVVRGDNTRDYSVGLTSLTATWHLNHLVDRPGVFRWNLDSSAGGPEFLRKCGGPAHPLRDRPTPCRATFPLPGPMARPPGRPPLVHHQDRGSDVGGPLALAEKTHGYTGKDGDSHDQPGHSPCRCVGGPFGPVPTGHRHPGRRGRRRCVDRYRLACPPRAPPRFTIDPTKNSDCRSRPWLCCFVRSIGAGSGTGHPESHAA